MIQLSGEDTQAGSGVHYKDEAMDETPAGY